MLALDAPLGWPAGLTLALSVHCAGKYVEASADELFNRETDRFVHAHLGKKPLSVGADLIAHTARAALELLNGVRQGTGEPVPLAWTAGKPRSLSAIEVYPAATIRSLRLPEAAYKNPGQAEARDRIFRSLPEWFNASDAQDACLQSSDVLDAVLCVLAGVEFIEGRVEVPENSNTAEREGWIWVGRQADR